MQMIIMLLSSCFASLVIVLTNTLSILKLLSLGRQLLFLFELQLLSMS
jgi:hypothetical protein